MGATPSSLPSCLASPSSCVPYFPPTLFDAKCLAGDSYPSSTWRWAGVSGQPSPLSHWPFRARFAALILVLGPPPPPSGDCWRSSVRPELLQAEHPQRGLRASGRLNRPSTRRTPDGAAESRAWGVPDERTRTNE